ncbi:hypothetical protein Ddye_028334 [Dipteronia dyeriana]|uniref:FAM86 N-terminal domain-containing protein n=1 Tax=Dipteronia dyeriana TaxID=168575 RepID=A0AAD9TQS1_9ROSI|nr:hypothetical protein Ddye_028334 [Dipteronia dyeriana]
MTDPLASPPWLLLVSAFLAMETADSLVSLAKVCGGGSITEKVQRFIWDHCINEAARKGHAPYLKCFLKKLINENESNCSEVLDELYEQYAYLMTSMKSFKGNARVRKYITFLFPDGCLYLPSCPKSRKLMFPLQCSLNMLEGDTGCSIWPSSLFLSEFILSFPDIFSNKSCFEVGSGVGLVGICLAHVKASKVKLTDGDLSTLANLRLNLELNQLITKTDAPEKLSEDQNVVKCFHLPWESASESEIHAFMPEIILAADVIYNPECFPHLVRVLANLMNQRKSCSQSRKDTSESSVPDSIWVETKVNGTNEGFIAHVHASGKSDSNGHGIDSRKGAPKRDHPVAYIATVIRNIDTFNYFLELAEQASLTVADITETLKPFNLLPYMQSYDRSSIRLFTVSSN